MGQGLSNEEIRDMHARRERTRRAIMEAEYEAGRQQERLQELDRLAEDMKKERKAQERRELEKLKDAIKKEQDQTLLAQGEAAEARQQAMEAQREAEIQREQILELKREIEDKKREEEKRREEFRWGPKESLKWTEEECQKLVNKLKLTEGVDNKPPRGHTFLLFGPTSHGKSSFANGCLAALENLNSPLMFHHVGLGDQSVSRKSSIHEYGLHRIIMSSIRELDTITSDSLKMFVTDQIDCNSKMTTNLDADQKTAHDNTVECIIIIMKYDCDLPPQLKRQIGAIMEVCGEGDVSYHLVLTHLDDCDPQFKDPANLPNLYKSPKVLKAVENMSDQTGIPAYNISFVKNYTTETETDLNSNLQYLRILDFVDETAHLIVKSRERKAKKEGSEKECMGKHVNLKIINMPTFAMEVEKALNKRQMFTQVPITLEVENENSARKDEDAEICPMTIYSRLGNEENINKVKIKKLLEVERGGSAFTTISLPQDAELCLSPFPGLLEDTVVISWTDVPIVLTFCTDPNSDTALTYNRKLATLLLRKMRKSVDEDFTFAFGVVGDDDTESFLGRVETLRERSTRFALRRYLIMTPEKCASLTRGLLSMLFDDKM